MKFPPGKSLLTVVWRNDPIEEAYLYAEPGRTLLRRKSSSGTTGLQIVSRSAKFPDVRREYQLAGPRVLLAGGIAFLLVFWGFVFWLEW